MASLRGKIDVKIVGAVAEEGARKGLVLATNHVLQVSNQRVPNETGDLERSGRATVDDLRGAVSYDTPYAVRQHEELTWRHSRGGRAKYLESALVDEAGTVRDIVAAQVRRALR